MSRRWRVYCITEGVNVHINSNTAPVTCPTNAGHSINAASITDVDSLPNGAGYFGDGRDGDVVDTVGGSLVRDMYYRNLTINTTGLFFTAGCRVFVADTLTLNGTICSTGMPGSAVTGGPSTTTLTCGRGAFGGNGGTANVVGSGGGSLPSSTRMGGLGGAGGAGSQAAGGAGSGTVPSAANGGTDVFRTVGSALRGRDLAGAQLHAGTGGGGGGGSATSSGGGGGGGGGVMVVAARNVVVNSGGFDASGAAGVSTSTTAGAGGGGGGGCIVLVTTSVVGSPTYNVNGGAAGGSTGGGGVGTAGAIGRSFILFV